MKLVNIEVIKDELERLTRDYRSYWNAETKYRYEAYKKLFEWLDGLEVEEPSKDLEEAARKVGQKYFPDENNIWARPNYEAIAAANAFKEGAKWQEEQIMKDAIEREVKVDAGGYPYIDATELYDYDNDKPLAKAGDKVKVVFIKDK